MSLQSAVMEPRPALEEPPGAEDSPLGPSVLPLSPVLPVLWRRLAGPRRSVPCGGTTGPLRHCSVTILSHCTLTHRLSFSLGPQAPPIIQDLGTSTATLGLPGLGPSHMGSGETKSPIWEVFNFLSVSSTVRGTQHQRPEYGVLNRSSRRR